MDAQETDRAFTGSVPDLYERHLVPLIFQPYADDLVDRLVSMAPTAVLEVAAGTGVVTRVMARRLPAATTILATDLNPSMLHTAQAISTARPVEWRPADAMSLPFDDGSFDAVVCQFGAMFFPDRATAFAEVRRVLRPGGVFLFNVWDRIEANELAHLVTEVAASVFPDDPPRFLSRTPHGYHDESMIRSDLHGGGFDLSLVEVEVVDRRSCAATAHGPAIAYCQGSPLRGELEQRDPDCLPRVTALAVEAITARFGESGIDAAIRALVVSPTRD